MALRGTTTTTRVRSAEGLEAARSAEGPVAPDFSWGLPVEERTRRRALGSNPKNEKFALPFSAQGTSYRIRFPNTRVGASRTFHSSDLTRSGTPGGVRHASGHLPRAVCGDPGLPSGTPQVCGARPNLAGGGQASNPYTLELNFGGGPPRLTRDYAFRLQSIRERLEEEPRTGEPPLQYGVIWRRFVSALRKDRAPNTSCFGCDPLTAPAVKRVTPRRPPRRRCASGRETRRPARKGRSRELECVVSPASTALSCFHAPLALLATSSHESCGLDVASRIAVSHTCVDVMSSHPCSRFAHHWWRSPSRPIPNR